MAAYPSDSSPPNPASNSPAAPAPAVGYHRAARDLGGEPHLLTVGGKANLTLASHAQGDMAKLTDITATCVGEVLMMQGGAGGSSNNPASAHNGANDVFIVDSGASVHATGNGALFSHLNAMPLPAGTGTTRCVVLRVANDSVLRVLGCGTVRRDNITLHGVLFSPGLAKNIVSVSKLGELGYNVEFTRTSCFIRDAGTGDLVGKGRLVDGLFELDFLEAPRF